MNPPKPVCPHCLRPGQMPPLPSTGFVRQKQIIGDRKHGIAGPLPIGPTKWWDGIQKGIFPAPIRLGNITMWRVEDVRALIERLASEGAHSNKGVKLAELRNKKRTQRTL
jgi:prophage regulatory protein